MEIIRVSNATGAVAIFKQALMAKGLVKIVSILLVMWIACRVTNSKIDVPENIEIFGLGIFILTTYAAAVEVLQIKHKYIALYENHIEIVYKNKVKKVYFQNFWEIFLVKSNGTIALSYVDKQSLFKTYHVTFYRKFNGDAEEMVNRLTSLLPHIRIKTIEGYRYKNLREYDASKIP